jgi:hypothetical protein
VIYKVVIFEKEHVVNKDELIDLLDSFDVDSINKIYHEMPVDIRNDLFDYFKKRMGNHLGF